MIFCAINICASVPHILVCALMLEHYPDGECIDLSPPVTLTIGTDHRPVDST